MKELSIEEKAKRYEEALERARKIENGEPIGVPDGTHIPVAIFPELAESGDERVRKNCIHFLELQKEHHASTVEIDECIAWLEKQGEQKSVDEIEPKFNLNDWVVTDKGDTVQIGAVNNGYYTLYNGMDFNMSYVDKCWRKWTIQDAKDGDVLMSAGNQPFIYNGKFTEYTVGAYCGLTTNKDFSIEKYNKGSNWTNNNNIRPAIKEQRDLLLKEMHRVSYEWDADKKELIKL